VNPLGPDLSEPTTDEERALVAGFVDEFGFVVVHGSRRKRLEEMSSVKKGDGTPRWPLLTGIKDASDEVQREFLVSCCEVMLHCLNVHQHTSHTGTHAPARTHTCGS
jgi:hypothetical protein